MLWSTAALRGLAQSLRAGPLSIELAPQAIQPLAGEHSAVVERLFRGLTREGLSPRQMAVVLELADTRDGAFDPGRAIELVLSGHRPVPAADTRATIHAIIASAHSELLLVGYAVHNGKELFAPLARRMEEVPALKVVFCLDIARRPSDTSLESEIVRRFAHDFIARHWPWQRRPSIHYDPRALSADPPTRASLHAKCVIADGQTALITSANFTAAAQQRNIEAGS